MFTQINRLKAVDNEIDWQIINRKSLFDLFGMCLKLRIAYWDVELVLRALLSCWSNKQNPFFNFISYIRVIWFEFRIKFDCSINFFSCIKSGWRMMWHNSTQINWISYNFLCIRNYGTRYAINSQLLNESHVQEYEVNV